MIPKIVVAVGRYSVLVGPSAKLPAPRFQVGATRAPIQGSLSVRTNAAGEALFTIGVGLDNDGASSIVLLPLQATARLVVAGGTAACGFDLAKAEQYFELELPFPVASVQLLDEEPRILFTHECGVVVTSFDGVVVWSYSRDVFQAVEVHGFRLRLTFMDEPPVDVDIATGCVLATKS